MLQSPRSKRWEFGSSSFIFLALWGASWLSLPQKWAVSFLGADLGPGGSGLAACDRKCPLAFTRQLHRAEDRLVLLGRLH